MSMGPSRVKGFNQSINQFILSNFSVTLFFQQIIYYIIIYFFTTNPRPIMEEEGECSLWSISWLFSWKLSVLWCLLDWLVFGCIIGFLYNSIHLWIWRACTPLCCNGWVGGDSGRSLDSSWMLNNCRQVPWTSVLCGQTLGWTKLFSDEQRVGRSYRGEQILVFHNPAQSLNAVPCSLGPAASCCLPSWMLYCACHPHHSSPIPTHFQSSQ